MNDVVKTVFKSPKMSIDYLPACGVCLNEVGFHTGIFIE